MEAGEGDELEDESKRRAISLVNSIRGEREESEKNVKREKEQGGRGPNPCLARSQMNDFREASLKP